MAYAKSAGTALETGWKYVASKIINAIQKVASVISGSLHLALFAFQSFVGNETVNVFISHMGLTSSKLSSEVSNRRALTALGVQFNEEALKIEQDSVEQALSSVSDVDNAPNGKELMDMVVSTHSSFTYPSLIHTAREMTRVFVSEMPGETASKIKKLADRLEKSLDTRNMVQKYSGLFKTSTPQSRRAMKKLLDTINYTHGNTDADFRAALSDLESKDNRDAKSALRELKSMVMVKQEEVEAIAMELLSAMALFERVPQNLSNAKKKKKKPSRYEDARSTFDTKLAGLYDDPAEEAAEKGRLDLVYMKIKQFTAAVILSHKGNFRMGLATLLTSFALSYISDIVGPGSVLHCAQILGNPFVFITSHIAQTWVVPHLTGLALPALEENSEELITSKGIVEESVMGTLNTFTESVKNQCVKTKSYIVYKTYELTSSSDTGVCVTNPIKDMVGRVSALKAIARSLQGNSNNAINEASSEFLREIGDLDVQSEINVPATENQFRDAAVDRLRGDESSALAFFKDFDQRVDVVNDRIKSYVSSLKSFFSSGVGYSYFRDAAQHLRSNARDEWLFAEKTAIHKVIGEKTPMELPTDTENIPEELRVRQALLPTPLERLTLFQRIKTSSYYARFYSTFTMVQEISQWSSILLLLSTSSMTTISVLLIQLLYSWVVAPWIGKRFFANYSESDVGQSLRKYSILNALSFGGSQFVGKAIYETLRVTRFALSVFFAVSFGTLVNSMFFPTAASFTDVGVIRQILTHSLIAISTKAISSTASAVTGRILKFDGWVERRSRSEEKVQ
jgi:hypothetical protein